MPLDALGVSEQALGLFDRAARAVLTHRPGVLDTLADALAIAPEFAGAHALAGLANVTLARSETMLLARQSLHAARASLARVGGSRGEMALVEALARSLDHGFAAGADRLDARLAEEPTDYLAAKLAHALQFMAGDALGMLTSVDRPLAALPAYHPARGFMLGCRAFALEELGAYSAAERLGRQAAEMDGEDAWAIHAVGHVHEMTGRAAEGLAWIEGRRSSWTRCNNFSLHLSWHAALLQLELGRVSAALDIFDAEVWPRASDDFRDMSNAVALLVRIEQSGVNVGDRWMGPADIAERRAADTTLVFAVLHNLVALVAAGRLEAARELVAALDHPPTGDAGQNDVGGRVGRPMARAILQAAGHGEGAIDFQRLLAEMPRLGGSNAQRDVFVRLLAQLAADRGDRLGLETVLSARANLKREDVFAATIRRRLDASVARPIAL